MVLSRTKALLGCELDKCATLVALGIGDECEKSQEEELEKQTEPIICRARRIEANNKQLSQDCLALNEPACSFESEYEVYIYMSRSR